MTQPENRQQNVSMSFVGSLGVDPRCDPVWESNQNIRCSRSHSKQQGSGGELLVQLGTERAPAFIPLADQGNFQKFCWLILKELGGSAPFSLQHPKASSQISFASLGLNRKELSLSWDKSFVVQLQAVLG